jgi:dihydroflavonol-4-reductase
VSRVLVTGGGGFIGRHVVQGLLAQGREVTVMLAPQESASGIERLGVPVVRADVRDLPALDAAVAGHRVVVHMAALYSLWMKDWRPLYDINVQGTENVLAACRRAGVDRLLYTSSIAALGVPPGMAPANEDTEFDQHGRCAPYILSKYYAERRVRAAQRAGEPIVTVYPSMPFGPGDHRPTPTGLLLLRALGGAYFAAGPGSINAVDVRDVAQGHLDALARAPDGGRYLLTGHHLPMTRFFELAHSFGGRSRPVLRVPMAGLRVLGATGDQVARFTEPLVDTPAVLYTSQQLTYDCSRAERDLGYTRRPIEETFADAIAWFRAQGYPEPGMALWDLGSRRKMRAAARRELGDG